MINIIKTHKKNIRSIFQQSLDLNSSSQIVFEYVTKLYSNNKNIYVVAIGKSATTMLEGAISGLGKKFISALHITKAYQISKVVLNHPLIQTIIAGHPIPTENSLYAGKNLIKFLLKLKTDDQLLFLISGGTSSLVEYLPNSISGLITIDELIKLNKWLLASDKNIIEVNKIRKKVSGIKAGRLLGYFKCRNVSSLYISDVPDDKLKNIGSGLLIPEDLTYEIKNLPSWINEIIKRSVKIPDSKIHNEKKINSYIIFSNTLLRKSLVDVAKGNGYPVHNMDDFISGNTITEAIRIAEWLKKQKSGLYIWGAETHMTLPATPGRGGRNQSFALAMARQIQNMSNIIVLLAGTDGNDGNTHDAGAIIDCETIKRGENSGLSATDCLENANAGVFLSASGDLLTLAATGTNVMDIIMAFIWD